MGGGLIFGMIQETNVNPKQEGNSAVTLRLSSIDSGGNQSIFTEKISPPPKPKPKKHKKRKHKEQKNKAIAQKSIPQETQEVKQAPKPTPASNLTQEGNSNTQTLAYNEGVSDEFLSKIRTAIASHNPYPRMARLRKMQGEVVLEFVLDIDGSLDGVKILSSTAGEILNKSALKALKRASREFPLPSQKVRIKVPIIYSLSA